MVAERDVEARFRALAKARGAWALKFVSPGQAGVPDRLVLMPDGTVRFVELKAPGETPRRLQRVVFDRFDRLGHPVAVLDNIDDVERWWGRR